MAALHVLLQDLTRDLRNQLATLSDETSDADDPARAARAADLHHQIDTLIDDLDITARTAQQLVTT